MQRTPVSAATLTGVFSSRNESTPFRTVRMLTISHQLDWKAISREWHIRSDILVLILCVMATPCAAQSSSGKDPASVLRNAQSGNWLVRIHHGNLEDEGRIRWVRD